MSVEGNYRILSHISSKLVRTARMRVPYRTWLPRVCVRRGVCVVPFDTEVWWGGFTKGNEGTNLSQPLVGLINSRVDLLDRLKYLK